MSSSYDLTPVVVLSRQDAQTACTALESLRGAGLGARQGAIEAAILALTAFYSGPACGIVADTDDFDGVVDMDEMDEED